MVGNGVDNIDAALQQNLGFKVPIISPKYVTQFPDVFEVGDCNFSGSVLSWVEHNLIGSSEHSVVSLDSAWEGILLGFLPGLTCYRDQHDPSSLPYERPDVTIVHNNCVVLKVEAKIKELDMNDAEMSLTSKFQGDAFTLFPRSSRAIIGVCTSESLVKIYKISYNFETKEYVSKLFPNAIYRVTNLQDRVNFLVDMMKLSKWIFTVDQPIKMFHLVPNVRTTTSNRHYITWNGKSIIKEFKGRIVDLQYIERIYKETLQNVEHGEVLSYEPPQAIRIHRVGRRLKDAIRNGFSKETALKHIQDGIFQLHNIGFGHGDVSLNNVCVDDNNIAFLDDLEYAAPIGTSIPKKRKPPSRAADKMSIEEFDLWRFNEMKVQMATL